MMEKAQKAKRKWNLDDKTGKAKNTKISKPLLLSVAKEVGLELLDGNPDSVEIMLELDNSRNTVSKASCKVPNCDVAHNIGDKNDTNFASSRRDTQSPIKNCQMEILTIRRLTRKEVGPQ